MKDEILYAFESFGKVDSVEILNDKASIHISSDGEVPVTHEAYVMFKTSADAYNTLKSRIFPKNLVLLVPADTWHQPDYKHSDEKPFKGIIQCDHRCNMESFTREFEEMTLHRDESLCEHMVTNFELELKSGTTLNEIRKILRCVMTTVGHLELKFSAEFDSVEDSDDGHFIGRADFQRRVIEIIGKYGVGPKLEALTIVGLAGFSMMMLQCLSSVLKPLTELNIFARYCNILYVLPLFCPKLDTLTLSGIEWEGIGSNETIQSWPTLEVLVFKGLILDVDHDSDSGKRFRRFISMNPQLNTLDLDLIVDNSLLKSIGKSVRNLKTLTFTRESFDNVGGMIDQLVRLKHLEAILVSTLIFKTNHFKSLISCVECLSKKKRLRMSTLIQNYVLNEEEPVSLDCSVPVKYHDNCNCHGDNRAITFADQGDSVDLPKNKPVIAILVCVSRHLKQADKTLESRILTMFKGTTKFYSNVLKTTTIEEEDRFIFVQISST